MNLIRSTLQELQDNIQKARANLQRANEEAQRALAELRNAEEAFAAELGRRTESLSSTRSPYAQGVLDGMRSQLRGADLRFSHDNSPVGAGGSLSQNSRSMSSVVSLCLRA